MRALTILMDLLTAEGVDGFLLGLSVGLGGSAMAYLWWIQ